MSTTDSIDQAIGNAPSSRSSPLELLVQDLNEQTKTFTDYLRANRLPEPSFERGTPNITSQILLAPEAIQLAREKLLDNALQIFQLVADLDEYSQNIMSNVSFIHSPQLGAYSPLILTPRLDSVPSRGNR